MQVLYSKKQIQKRVEELAEYISKDYQGKKLLLLGVLKGGFVFLSDLQRALFEKGIGAEVDFIKVSSYLGTEKGTLTVSQNLTSDISGKHVLIVEDILDTGETLSFLKEHIEKMSPESLKIVAFLDKKDNRKIEAEADYVGFTLSGKPWVEGYGLDTDNLGRGNPEIIDKTARN